MYVADRTVIIVDFRFSDVFSQAEDLISTEHLHLLKERFEVCICVPVCVCVCVCVCYVRE